MSIKGLNKFEVAVIGGGNGSNTNTASNDNTDYACEKACYEKQNNFSIFAEGEGCLFKCGLKAFGNNIRQFVTHIFS